MNSTTQTVMAILESVTYGLQTNTFHCTAAKAHDTCSRINQSINQTEFFSMAKIAMAITKSTVA